MGRAIRRPGEGPGGLFGDVGGLRVVGRTDRAADSDEQHGKGGQQKEHGRQGGGGVQALKRHDKTREQKAEEGKLRQPVHGGDPTTEIEEPAPPVTLLPAGPVV